MTRDLEIDAVRAAMGGDVIRALDAWGLPRDHQRELLTLSPDEWARVQRGAPLPLQFDVIERVECLLTLAGQRPAAWFGAPTTAGDTPVEQMLGEGLSAMQRLLAASDSPSDP